MMFILFSFDPLAPRGGWGDFLGVYETQDEAVAIGEKTQDAWQVVDLGRRSVVANGKAKA